VISIRRPRDAFPILSPPYFVDCPFSPFRGRIFTVSLDIHVETDRLVANTFVINTHGTSTIILRVPAFFFSLTYIRRRIDSPVVTKTITIHPSTVLTSNVICRVPVVLLRRTLAPLPNEISNCLSFVFGVFKHINIPLYALLRITKYRK